MLILRSRIWSKLNGRSGTNDPWGKTDKVVTLTNIYTEKKKVVKSNFQCNLYGFITIVRCELLFSAPKYSSE